MFYGREKELNVLNQRYDSDQFECIILYGRRRVGKTSLIKEFIKDKDAIFFSAVEMSKELNLMLLSQEITKDQGSTFSDFTTALQAIIKQAQQKKLIFVIDEYPYLAKADPSISSQLQHMIDHYAKTTNLKIILCGSSMSFMEHQVLGYQSPLYGRRTAQLKILPFDFFDSSKFFPNYTFEDCVLMYGACGGVPEYLSYMNSSLSADENIIQNILEPSSLLYEEPQNLLKQELREPARYQTILTIIANGATKLNDIASKAHMDQGLCANYMKSLLELGIVQKQKSVLEKSEKKYIYTLTDPFFRFWYRFIPTYGSLLALGHSELVYREKIKPALNEYLGHIFEEICIQYFLRQIMNGTLDFLFTEIGPWWRVDSKTKTAEEIDIVITDETKGISAECKWTNTKVDQRILDKLIQRSKLCQLEIMQYYLFSKSGFSDQVLQGEAICITQEDFLQLMGR